jgi:hypothetical protein
MCSAAVPDIWYEPDMPPNAPYERRGHSRLSLALYDSRGRSMRLLGLAGRALTRFMSQQAKPWHDRESHEQSDIYGTRYLVTTAYEFSEGLILKEDSKYYLSNDRKCKCEKPGCQRATRETYIRETPKYVPSSKENHCSHDGHFCELCPALANSWHKKRNPQNA